RSHPSCRRPLMERSRTTHLQPHPALKSQISNLKSQISNLKEPRTKNQEPRTKNQEPRTKNNFEDSYLKLET
ncbi:MAG: hypothetical protein ACK5JP_00410, partial [Akkermansiaceae bacterium]